MASVKNGERNLYSAVNPFRVGVDYDPMIVTDEDGQELPSKTRQEFMAECDVNEIMRRYEKAGGQWPLQDPNRQPYYADFVGMPDLQSAMAAMIAADEAFMTLPAVVRKEFDNDATRFVEYAQNRDNLDQLRKWGLAPPEKAPPEPVSVRVVPDTGIQPEPSPEPPKPPGKAPAKGA